MKHSAPRSSLISFFSLSLVLAGCGNPSPTQGAGLAPATEAAPPAYARLLETYATPKGVRYAAWHAHPGDRAALKEVVEFYAGTLPPPDRDTALAWHLNAYNAWILHHILKKYPTGGPLDGDKLFFHTKRITLSGKKTSFDQMEQRNIRPVFNEPRIHFALNCASESCPPLQPRPFTAATLDADLDRLARAFINQNPQGVVSGRDGPKLSKIFEWYAGDFGGKENLIASINRYRQEPLPPGAAVRFLDYSWKLNAAP